MTKTVIDTDAIEVLRLRHGYEDVVPSEEFLEKARAIADSLLDGYVSSPTNPPLAQAAIAEGIFAGYAREEIGCATWRDDATFIAQSIRETFYAHGGFNMAHLVCEGIMHGTKLHEVERGEL